MNSGGACSERIVFPTWEPDRSSITTGLLLAGLNLPSDGDSDNSSVQLSHSGQGHYVLDGFLLCVLLQDCKCSGLKQPVKMSKEVLYHKETLLFLGLFSLSALRHCLVHILEQECLRKYSWLCPFGTQTVGFVLLGLGVFWGEKK